MLPKFESSEPIVLPILAEFDLLSTGSPPWRPHVVLMSPFNIGKYVGLLRQAGLSPAEPGHETTGARVTGSNQMEMINTRG